MAEKGDWGTEFPVKNGVYCMYMCGMGYIMRIVQVTPMLAGIEWAGN